MRHILQFWKVEQADANVGQRLDHTASAQFDRVSPGDVLWIVTVRDHRLKLLGRLVVDAIVNQREAERRLGRTNLYPAPLHAISARGIEAVREIDIQDIAGKLRFNSPHDRLTFRHPDVTDGKQLQSLRELSEKAAEELSERWHKGVVERVESRSRLPSTNERSTPAPESANRQSPRQPSTFDEFKKAYSYVLDLPGRTVIPAHQNYQVRLKRYLAKKKIDTDMEKDFIDVDFVTNGEHYIGEIKVTTHLTLQQAFRTALGQILDYANSMFKKPPRMIMFLDERPDSRRLELATRLGIAVVVEQGNDFVLLNPGEATTTLCRIFPIKPELAQAAAKQ